MNLTHDKEFQRQLLNHPAYRHQGVDPLWRIIAIMGWVTVLALMVALSARSQTLVVGLNGKRASSPVSVEAKTSPSGLANATAEMKPLLWSNDDRSLSHGLSRLGVARPGTARRGAARQGKARQTRASRAVNSDINSQ